MGAGSGGAAAAPEPPRRAGLPGRGRQLCDARPVFARLDGSVPLPASAPSSRGSPCLPPKSRAPGGTGLCGCCRPLLHELKSEVVSGCKGQKIKILPPSRCARVRRSSSALGFQITPGVFTWGMSLSPRQHGPARPWMDLQARGSLLWPAGGSSGSCCCRGDRGKRFGAWWMFILLNMGNVMARLPGAASPARKGCEGNNPRWIEWRWCWTLQHSLVPPAGEFLWCGGFVLVVCIFSPCLPSLEKCFLCLIEENYPSREPQVSPAAVQHLLWRLFPFFYSILWRG